MTSCLANLYIEGPEGLKRELGIVYFLLGK